MTCLKLPDNYNFDLSWFLWPCIKVLGQAWYGMCATFTIFQPLYIYGRQPSLHIDDLLQSKAPPSPSVLFLSTTFVRVTVFWKVTSNEFCPPHLFPRFWLSDENSNVTIDLYIVQQESRVNIEISCAYFFLQTVPVTSYSNVIMTFY